MLIYSLYTGDLNYSVSHSVWLNVQVTHDKCEAIPSIRLNLIKHHLENEM